MPNATIHPLAEDSPTKASVRAVTRDTMLHTISDRIQQSHEQHQGPVRDEAEQHRQSAASSHQENQVPQNEGSLSPGKPTRQLPCPRYNIERLVELGKNVQVSSEVLLKVKPDAIAGMSGHPCVFLHINVFNRDSANIQPEVADTIDRKPFPVHGDRS